MCDEATEQIQKALQKAIGASKCHRCGCFSSAVSALAGLSDVPAPLRAVLDEARGVCVEPEYDCLGCDPCWPADAINVPSQLTAIDPATICAAPPVAARDGWPPLAGDYEVVRFAAPVAVCTLHSRSLGKAIGRRRPAGLCMVGSLETENLGIERLVANICANPHIRRLLLCGADSEREVGHFPGQSLLALVDNGIDPRARIIDARGRRPVLRNIDRALIEHFRRQVEVIDHRGVEDLALLAGVITEQAEGAPGPVESLPAGAPSIESIEAAPPPELVLDPAGYVVIYVDRTRQRLVAEHYKNSGVLDLVLSGQDGPGIAAELISRALVTRLDHAAYLGRELSLAERALREGTDYRQDRAPDSDVVGVVGGVPGGKPR